MHLTADDRKILRVLETYRLHGPYIPAHFQWEAPESTGSFEALHAFQGHRCALCGGDEAHVTDHCHRSGLVRGYLCQRCNQREGIGGALPGLLDAYRRRPPAVVVGWTEPYVGFGYTWDRPARPEKWVVEELGLVPDDPAGAAQYLEAAAYLEEPRPSWEDNALIGIGL